MKNQTFIIVVLVAVFVVILAVAWYLVSQPRPTYPSSSGESSPAGAPIDIPQTNPFGGVKFNPFE